MRTNVKKPIAVLLSALMLLTVVSVGLVPLAAFAAPVADSMDLDYSLGAGTYSNGTLIIESVTGNMNITVTFKDGSAPDPESGNGGD